VPQSCAEAAWQAPNADTAADARTILNRARSVVIRINASQIRVLGGFKHHLYDIGKSAGAGQPEMTLPWPPGLGLARGNPARVVIAKFVSRNPRHTQAATNAADFSIITRANTQFHRCGVGTTVGVIERHHAPLIEQSPAESRPTAVPLNASAPT